MNIPTKFHGEIEINEADFFTFQNGIPGFLDEQTFTLLPLADTPFVVLQSVTTKEVAFISINPFEVFSTYEIDLSQDVLDDLHIQLEQDVAVFTILTIREPFEESTANLQAPVILNTKNKRGKQYIMKTDHYTTRHLFIEEALKMLKAAPKVAMDNKHH